MSFSATPPKPPGAGSSSSAQGMAGTPAENYSQIDGPYGWDKVKVLDEGRLPCQRSLHAAAVWNDSLYVFGGYDGQARVNDMYEYNFHLKRWRNTPPSMVTPSPRDRHAAVVSGNTFYIFGGFDGTSRVNDFWGYNFETQGWAMVPTASGEPPSPRHSHMAVTYKDSMFVFGGYDGSYRCDFHEYNFNTETWSHVNSAGRQPRCRYRASCVVHDDTMIMFGGHDGSRHLNDTNIYNFLSNTWTQVPNSRATPSPRDSHIAVVYQDSMFVFGGSTGEATDDFYELKLRKFGGHRLTWSKVDKSAGTGEEEEVEEELVEDAEGEVETTGSPSSRSLFHGSREEEGGWDGGNFANFGNPRQRASGSSDSVFGFADANHKRKRIENTHLPGRRFCHVGHIFEDCLYVFGGYDGHYRLNDFIRFRFGSPETAFKVGPSTLLSELKAMVNNPSMSDVTFACDDGTRVFAHKFMLSRCEFFRAMLLGDMAEGQEESKDIMMPDISAPTLLVVFEYLYTDEVDFSCADTAMDLFQAADRFGIPRLKGICENVILKSICVDNAASIFYAADMYNAKALRDKTLSFMLMHFTEITKTAAFEEMGRTNIELVFEFLKKIDG